VRTLGLDYGERRIGIAISDPTSSLARPLTTISTDGTLVQRVAALAEKFSSLIADGEEFGLVVVGLPKALDGSPHQQTARVIAFVAELRRQISLPLKFQDERLTSVEAEQRLAITQPDWRKRKIRLDAASAAIILQDYLDQQQSLAQDGPFVGSTDGC